MARESWNSYHGFILATIGSAVGIGSIWRFPYLVYSYEGASFLLAYIIVLFTFGLSFMCIELAVGMHYKTSLISALASIRERFRFIGLFSISVTIGILSYYSVILGWILAYIIQSITNDYYEFNEFVNSWYPILAFIAVAILNYIIVAKGIRSGIEMVSKYGMLSLFAILVFLTLIGLNMDKDGNGLRFYFEYNNMILEPNVWATAIGQAFFSLSIGFGLLVTYGSYVRERKQSIVFTSIIIILSVLTVTFLSGLMVFTLSAQFVDYNIHGIALIFKIMPLLFSSIENGYVLGTMFFVLLFIAGITSSISMLQIPTSALEDTFKLSKMKAASITTMVVVSLGIPSLLSYSPLQLTLFGNLVLDLFDYLFGTIAITISATLIIIAVTWFMCKDKIMYQINLYSRVRYPTLLLGVVKTFLPLMIIVTLVKILLFP